MGDSIKIKQDLKGNLVVQVDEIIFRNKQNIDWNEVERYARKYINEVYCIATDGEYINVGIDFPDEFAHSNDTERLRGGNAKNGWYRYSSRIALPISKDDKIVRYNVYLVTVLIRHAENGKNIYMISLI